MKFKKIAIFVFCCIFLLSLTGCTKQEYAVQIFDNNNVYYFLKVSIEKQYYDLLYNFDIDFDEFENKKVTTTGTSVDKVNPLFQEIAMLYYSYGFNVTPIDDDNEIGFFVEKTYMTIEEFNQEVKKLYEGKLSGLNLVVEYENTSNKKKYYVSGNLDYIIDADMGLSNEDIYNTFKEQYKTSTMTAKAKITMPMSTQVTNHDGSLALDNYSIEWMTAYEKESQPIHAISSWADYRIYYVIGICGVLVVGVVVFAVAKKLKLKKERDTGNSDFLNNEDEE